VQTASSSSSSSSTDETDNKQTQQNSTASSAKQTVTNSFWTVEVAFQGVQLHTISTKGQQSAPSSSPTRTSAREKKKLIGLIKKVSVVPSGTNQADLVHFAIYPDTFRALCVCDFKPSDTFKPTSDERLNAATLSGASCLL
jgi:hypothetical protein